MKFESSWVSTGAFAELKYAGMWKQALLPVKTSYMCTLHLRTKRARIFLLSISTARRGSLEKCAAAVFVSLSLYLSRSFFAVLPFSRTPFPFVRCTLAHCHTVRRKQIFEGDACRNVSQLISCWRNMVVIKRAFSLYGAHSKTSGVAQSSSGKVAVREYLTLMCQLACGYSYRTIMVFCIHIQWQMICVMQIFLMKINLSVVNENSFVLYKGWKFKAF